MKTTAKIIALILEVVTYLVVGRGYILTVKPSQGHKGSNIGLTFSFFTHFLKNIIS